ncbi:phosphoribosylformylglycinamidine synthase [Dissulfurispira thermophila]|uniref:Phosphoribosylformylglycinamidine synthase n=2 Tax=root TaxID=1 RepID=A0A7G1GZI0_9BACT|nr:phosphoribosylformylglycinamidine synthase [Dissulfurispira thermophila]BCB95678.1 phosphoribosylformylglycinamidine synthase [Dissulfurispira thermophila]
MSENGLLHLYRIPAISSYKKSVLLKTIRENIIPDIEDIETEFCFNIEITEPLTEDELNKLKWLLSETFEPDNFSDTSFLTLNTQVPTLNTIVEVGPRMNFTTAWSTNAVSICHACGLTKINRIERSRRYKLICPSPLQQFTNSPPHQFLGLIHDRMTECLYPEPLKTFKTGIKPQSVRIIPLIEEGKHALVRLNKELGLGLDDWDIDYYYNLFTNELKRNPTDVECFDLSQSNSEHSRHWFFRGKLVIDGKEIPESLMQIVKEPYRRNPCNSIIAFKDNSSAIRGYTINTILPDNPLRPSPFKKTEATYHIIFTAETHNFPTGVAPFPGAETGTGGRIRDVHATGKGSLVIAGTAGYCVGNLFIPNYPLPWEHGSFIYPKNLASPLQIEIEASNGASDYGNKFGEPIIQGFTRSFGLKLPDGERREWIKPIMFTGGIGQIDARHIEKGLPEKGMVVVKLGGPAYRIGMGGGAASSVVSGELAEELDFNAVQRGDAEMEQKLNRVIRACVELGDKNPIISIHDQGAGGNCNVVKEIIHPAGAKIDIRKIIVGDNTLSVMEIWGAEYQEQDALLIHSSNISMFKNICEREKVPVAIIGEVTGDGYIVLYDSNDNSVIENLNLERVLGDMPQKTFYLERLASHNQPLHLPKNMTVMDALERVLRLISVGSKRFLTNKVDRSVTGLIARQQCCGPLQLTVSDVAVIAQSHFGLTGAAISIGEQPIKCLINPSAMARMSVGEALTNIVWAKISSLRDIKCSANWMWAPKLPGEGANLYDAAIAMRDIMLELGIAVDGGKDSLSMAAKVLHPSGEIEIVKSPPALVISAYAPCPDITRVITPDIKRPGTSRLIYIDLGNGKNRLGGSAIAHCYKQIGDESPDVDNTILLKDAFNAIQKLIDKDLILSGHDRSDGGLITTLLEMAFSGNCGIEIDLRQKTENEVIALLFSEELGMVIEYIADKEDAIVTILESYSIPYQIIGRTSTEKRIKINLMTHDSRVLTVLDEDMCKLRSIWEETSHRLDMLQANPECVLEEKDVIYDRTGPSYKVSFTPVETPKIILKKNKKPIVAIIREEGSNGDREMTSAFYMAGFEPWDVTMTDMLNERINLSKFKGIAFVGGFSYADVMDSAKGWAGTIRFNKRLYEQFYNFYNRPDTFSLGVCNGCQLMALLGWVPWQGIDDRIQPRFIHNKSGRFESRFLTVKIIDSPSIMLKDMEDSVLGVWIAHGEGLAHFPDKNILNEVIDKKLAPIRYVDDNGEFTEKYPFNPNDSPLGIAALCTPDGRHLAMMPHPERAFLKWQWAWMPEDMKKNIKASPWLKMFQNAYNWCIEKYEMEV